VDESCGNRNPNGSGDRRGRRHSRLAETILRGGSVCVPGDRRAIPNAAWSNVRLLGPTMWAYETFRCRSQATRLCFGTPVNRGRPGDSTVEIGAGARADSVGVLRPRAISVVSAECCGARVSTVEGCQLTRHPVARTFPAGTYSSGNRSIRSEPSTSNRLAQRQASARVVEQTAACGADSPGRCGGSGSARLIRQAPVSLTPVRDGPWWVVVRTTIVPPKGSGSMDLDGPAVWNARGHTFSKRQTRFEQRVRRQPRSPSPSAVMGRP